MQIIHDNQVWTSKEDDFFRFWEPSELPEAEPTPEWKKAKIPLTVWYKFVAFSLASYKKHKAESMVFFYYDEKKDTWDIWAPPQETQGMTVNVDEEHSNFAKQRKDMPPMFFGTGHHHCSTTAFQSGTDESDELEKEGVHFTLGCLNEKVLDIDARMVIDGVCHEIHPMDIVETPKWVGDIPFPELRQKAALEFLGQRFQFKFPDFWMKNVKKKTYRSSYKGNYSNVGYGQAAWWEEHYGLGGNIKDKEEDTSEEPELRLLAPAEIARGLKAGDEAIGQVVGQLVDIVIADLHCTDADDLLAIMTSGSKDPEALLMQSAIMDGFTGISVIESKVIEVLEAFVEYETLEEDEL